jgi:hypothetical protein
LPKKQSKFQHFKTQAKTHFQKLIKSVKSQKQKFQNQEFIAEIEVKK